MLLEGAISKVCTCHVSHTHSEFTDFLPEISLTSLYSAYSLLSMVLTHFSSQFSFTPLRNSYLLLFPILTPLCKTCLIALHYTTLSNFQPIHFLSPIHHFSTSYAPYSLLYTTLLPLTLSSSLLYTCLLYTSPSPRDS